MTHRIPISENRPWVVAFADRPLATIEAPNLTVADDLAWAMYGAGALAYARESRPLLYAQAWERECKADREARTESIWQALVKKFTR